MTARHKPTTTTALHASVFGHAHNEYGGITHVCERPTAP